MAKTSNLQTPAPLEQWLEQHSAREAWSIKAPGGARVSCYVAGVSTAIAVIRPGGGWDLYTPDGGNDVEATLADATERVTCDTPPRADATLAAALAEEHATIAAATASLREERDRVRAAFDRVSEEHATLAAEVARLRAELAKHAPPSPEERAAHNRAVISERLDPVRDDLPGVEPVAPVSPTVSRGWR